MDTESDTKLLDEFESEDMFKRIYPKYAIGIGILTVGLMDEHCPEEEFEDRCIVVYLKKPLTENVLLPSVYHGIKVFTEVVGMPKFQ